MIDKYRCRVCGRQIAVYSPKGGDGSFMKPYRHKGIDGKLCDGQYQEAVPIEWLTARRNVKETGDKP